MIGLGLALTESRNAIGGGGPAPNSSYLIDSYTGVNGTLLSDHLTDTGDTWTVHSGELEINSGMVRGSVNSRGVESIATFPAQSKDVTIQLTFTLKNQSVRPIAIIGRLANANNYYKVQVFATGNGFQIIQVSNGTPTLKAFTGGFLIANDVEYVLRVTFSGATITATLNNLVVQYTAATLNQTANKFGISITRDTDVNDSIYGHIDLVDSYVVWPGSGEMPANPIYPIILTIKPFQVLQRDDAGHANIPVVGICMPGVHTVEARWNNQAYQTVATNINGGFSGLLSNQDQGQGVLDVRFADDNSQSVSVPYVGIGDVFAIYGQSNAVGHLTTNQVYTHAYLKAGIFGNDYRWRELIDPTDSAVDQKDSVSNDALAGAEAGGSYWPLLATSIMASTGVPVAFVPCALGGTAIITFLPQVDHLNRATLYGSMLYRILSVGGVKDVLQEQGESDATVLGFTTGAVYKARLKTLADSIHADTGRKLIVAGIHYWSSAPSTTVGNVEEINQAMIDAANEDANVVFGPNMHSPSDAASGLHYTSNGDGIEVASRWFAALKIIYGWA